MQTKCINTDSPIKEAVADLPYMWSEGDLLSISSSRLSVCLTSWLYIQLFPDLGKIRPMLRAIAFAIFYPMLQRDNVFVYV